MHIQLLHNSLPIAESALKVLDQTSYPQESQYTEHAICSGASIAFSLKIRHTKVALWIFMKKRTRGFICINEVLAFRKHRKGRFFCGARGKSESLRCCGFYTKTCPKSIY